MALHCSHFHGRGKWSVRFDPDNCEALCYGCHSYMGANPYEHEKRIREKLGGGLFDILLEKANDTSLGRLVKKSESEVRKFYREKHEHMKELRLCGKAGRIDFEGWG